MSTEEMEEASMTGATSSPVPGEVFPLGMNCEDAMSFVISHLQSQEGSTDVIFPDLSSLSNSAFLETIAEMMLTPSLTECIGIAFYPILPDLVGRWGTMGVEIEKVACGLGRLIFLEPRLKRYLALCAI